MTESAPVQEVLRLMIEHMEGGIIYIRELAFFDTHEVYCRISRREDDTECPLQNSAWQRRGTWKDLIQLQIKASEVQVMGGTCYWNPTFSPGMREFRKEISFQ